MNLNSANKFNKMTSRWRDITSLCQVPKAKMKWWVICFCVILVALLWAVLKVYIEGGGRGLGSKAPRAGSQKARKTLDNRPILFYHFSPLFINLPRHLHKLMYRLHRSNSSHWLTLFKPPKNTFTSIRLENTVCPSRRIIIFMLWRNTKSFYQLNHLRSGCLLPKNGMNHQGTDIFLRIPSRR